MAKGQQQPPSPRRRDRQDPATEAVRAAKSLPNPVLSPEDAVKIPTPVKPATEPVPGPGDYKPPADDMYDGVPEMPDQDDDSAPDPDPAGGGRDGSGSEPPEGYSKWSHGERCSEGFYGFATKHLGRGYVGGRMAANVLSRPGMVYYQYGRRSYAGINVTETVIVRRRTGYPLAQVCENPFLLALRALMKARTRIGSTGDITIAGETEGPDSLNVTSHEGMTAIISPGGAGKSLLLCGLNAAMITTLGMRSVIYPSSEREGGADGSPEFESRIITRMAQEFDDRQSPIITIDSFRLRFAEGTVIGTGGVPKDFAEMATAMQLACLPHHRFHGMVINPLIERPLDDDAATGESQKRSLEKYLASMTSAENGIISSISAAIMIREFYADKAQKGGYYTLSVQAAPHAREPVMVRVFVPFTALRIANRHTESENAA